MADTPMTTQNISPLNWPDPYHNPQMQATRKDPKAEEFEYGHFQNRNGLALFFRGWKLKQTPFPSQPIIVLHIHGMISHSEPYMAMADGIVSTDTIVYGLDLEGHGHSEGIRGDYADQQIFLDNIDDALGYLTKKYPNSKIVLSGESMGGLLVTLYLTTVHFEKHQYPIEKVILWAPAYAPLLGTVNLQAVWLGITFLFKLLFAPKRVSIKPIHQDTFRDPLSFEYDLKDPINLQSTSARYTLNVKKGMDKLKRINAPTKIDISICIIHGTGDLIVSQAESQKFFEQCPTNGKSCYIKVPEAWHCIYKDPAFTEEYWKQLRGFLK
jgi:alpha-beta hydrolase superfamily lysophospholipase